MTALVIALNVAIFFDLALGIGFLAYVKAAQARQNETAIYHNREVASIVEATEKEVASIVEATEKRVETLTETNTKLLGQVKNLTNELIDLPGKIREEMKETYEGVAKSYIETMRTLMPVPGPDAFDPSLLTDDDDWSIRHVDPRLDPEEEGYVVEDFSL